MIDKSSSKLVDYIKFVKATDSGLKLLQIPPNEALNKRFASDALSSPKFKNYMQAIHPKKSMRALMQEEF